MTKSSPHLIQEGYPFQVNVALGSLPFNPKFRKLPNGDKWYGSFLEKFPEDPKIVVFPKSELFNWTFGIFRVETPSLLMTVYLAKLCSFLEILENAVPFVTGNFRCVLLSFSNRTARVTDWKLLSQASRLRLVLSITVNNCDFIITLQHSANWRPVHPGCLCGRYGNFKLFSNILRRVWRHV